MGSYSEFLRLFIFLSLLISFGLLEMLLPRRERNVSKPMRWGQNLGMSVLNALTLKLLIPTTAMSIAYLADSRGWGLLNLLDTPYWIQLLFALLVLDLAIYWQHRVFHAVPLLWRFHKMHHSDGDIDTSTALRFHPIEILLSMLIKFGVIIAIGAPALAVFLFEIILNGMAMFNHSNLRLPLVLDKLIRIIFVTPDMHRVHHSQSHHEMNSNYGFNLSCWDRWFNSYHAQPEEGHLGMHIGLSNLKPEELHFFDLLALPFKPDEPRRDADQ